MLNSALGVMVVSANSASTHHASKSVGGIILATLCPAAVPPPAPPESQSKVAPALVMQNLSDLQHDPEPLQLSIEIWGRGVVMITSVA